MARVLVHAADLDGGRIIRLRVKLHNLPARTIDRDTALAWLKDHHSLLVVRNGSPAEPLRLTDADEPCLRTDVSNDPSDLLEGLPALAAARV
jgi:hypothetical protein